MKKLFLFIVAAIFAAVSFSACSDDDKGDNNAPSKIVGTWGIAHFYFEEDGHKVDFDVSQSDEDWHKLVFKADGTFTIEYADGTDTGNYSINGNTITMKYVYEGDSETEVMTIKTLNATTLVFEQFEEDEGYFGKFVYTYKRL